MQPTLFRVILPVSDIKQAAKFYGQLLDQAGMRVSEGRHYFNCGATILACFDPRADGDNQTASPNPDHIYFAVDDIEKTWTACKSAGATMQSGDIHGTPAGEIHTRPWGEKSFYVIDPFGNKICFVDRTTTFTG